MKNFLLSLAGLSCISLSSCDLAEDVLITAFSDTGLRKPITGLLNGA